MIKNSQSIFFNNYLETLHGTLYKDNNRVDPKAAKILFSLWKNGSSVDKRTYNRPSFMSQEDINVMKNSDLIITIGEKIEITKKGENVIKVMVLGDDRSIFDKTAESDDIDYNTALNNTKNIKTSSGWWERFDK
jgi:hypothetical protein